MEQIDTGADGPEPGRRRYGGRVVAAALTAAALVAGTVGIAATRGGNHRPPAPLVLSRSGAAFVEAPAGADQGFGYTPYRFRLGIAPPDFGVDAPVGRAEPAQVDDGRVRTMADALALHGSVTHTHDGGWEVRAGTALLTVTKAAGGWDVTYAFDAATSAPGSVPGSVGTGSAGSGSAGSANGSAGEVGPPVPAPAPVPGTTKVPRPPIVTPSTELGLPAPNLPGPAGAERIARALLERIGAIDDSWSATTYDSSRDSVACAPAPCAEPDHILLTSRTVDFHPHFEGHVVAGISWLVEVGNNSQVLSVSGSWATVRTIGRYRLRSVAAVFADLANGTGWSAGPVPMSAVTGQEAASGRTIEPTTVTIDRVRLGYAVMPAFDNGAVVDIVPTYVFSGHTADGTKISQELVAAETQDTGPTGPKPRSPEATVSGTTGG